jgi:hypothetical protein
MRLIAAIVILAASSSLGLAQTPPPDPNKKITLTVKELQDLIAAQVAAQEAQRMQQLAAQAIADVNQQLAPPKASPQPPRASPLALRPAVKAMPTPSAMPLPSRSAPRSPCHPRPEMTAPWERPCSAPQKVLLVLGYTALLVLWGSLKIPAVVLLLAARILYLPAVFVNRRVDLLGVKLLDWLTDEKSIEKEE